MELNKENVAVIAAIGLLIGTLITNAITFVIYLCKERSERLKRVRELNLEKGEELYRLILLHKETISIAHINWVHVIDGNLTNEQLNEMTIEDATKNPERKNLAVRIELLAALYFPFLSKNLKESRKILAEANQVYFSLRKGINNPQRARNVVLDSSQLYSDKLEEILSDLATEIRNKTM